MRATGVTGQRPRRRAELERMHRSVRRLERLEALEALRALAGPGAVGGGQALVGTCDAHGLDDAVGVLDAWLDAHD